MMTYYYKCSLHNHWFKSHYPTHAGNWCRRCEHGHLELVYSMEVDEKEGEHAALPEN